MPIRAYALLLALLLEIGVREASATICIQDDIELERVQGIVLDMEKESLLAGVTLTLSRQGGRYERSQISDHEGFFSIETVPDGDYVLEAQLDGFLTHQAVIRVRKGTNLSQVLIVTITVGLEECGYAEMTSVEKARRLQEGILHQRSKRQRKGEEASAGGA